MSNFIGNWKNHLPLNKFQGLTILNCIFAGFVILRFKTMFLYYNNEQHTKQKKHKNKIESIKYPTLQKPR